MERLKWVYGRWKDSRGRHKGGKITTGIQRKERLDGEAEGWKD
jgi:hypothetical protein